MREAAAAIRARAAELLPLVIAETGATATVGSRMQVPVAADRFERYSRDPRSVLQTPLLPQPAQATPLAPGGIIGGMVNRQPLGVVACITSYNFPMVNMAGKVAPALAAGNTVVVKPAPQDPLAIVELVRILHDVGFPPGVVNLVNGNTPASSSALVEAGDVDCVSFTGSTQVGVKIAEMAARTMKRSLLELGGKGACVVLDDADVKAAVGCIGSTWSFHSGQICTAPTRAVVHRSLFDQVRDGLVQMAGFLPVGDPTDPKTVIGPVISAAQRGRIEAHIESAREDGGEVVIGGQRPADLPQGLLCRADPDHRRQHHPGGAGGDIRAGHHHDPLRRRGRGHRHRQRHRVRALRLRVLQGRSGTPGGQAASGGPRRGDTAQRNHDAPFGGFKMSGWGRDGGDYGLLAYTEPQSIIWSS